MDPVFALFWVFAVLAVAGALGVVVMRQPVHSALCLLATLLAVAGLFVLNHAEFLFAVQMLVYAGGIMVLFLFTIMLVNVRRTAAEPFIHSQAGLAIVVGLLLLVVVGGFVIGEVRRVTGLELTEAADPAKLARVMANGKEVLGNSQAVAWGLYRDYLLPFEVASVFLLVAMIGAVVLGKRTMEKID
ncbi:MAG: NADH-quinone oxidoreductase subunit J [Thermoanaerobaculia bacterium]